LNTSGLVSNRDIVFTLFKRTSVVTMLLRSVWIRLRMNCLSQ
jgi:hypothetical protein